MNRRTLTTGIAAGATALAVIAVAAIPATGAVAASKYNTSATVNVGLVLEPTDLNVRTTAGIALDQVLIDNVYQGLVGLSPQGKIVNVLAKKRTISKSGLTYTFTLNDGIHFSDGKKLTASGVAWSLNQERTNKTYTGYAALSGVTSITAKSNKVVVKLSTPNIELLYTLAGRAGLVLEKGAKNNLKTSAIGTGPFKLTTWKQGDSITLTRDDSNWGPNASVKKVVFHYITNRATATTSALAGNLQVQTAVDPTLKARYASSKTLKLYTGSTTDKYTLVFNNSVAPLNNLKVRQALSQAINPKAIIAAGGGAGVALGGPIPVSDPGYQNLTSVNKYNVANAKKLLAASGQSNLSLTVTIPNIYPTTITDTLVTEFKAIGVTLKVNSVDFTTWLTNVYTNKDYQLSIVDHAEAHDFNNYVKTGYYFDYSNKKVTALYAKALKQTTVAAESTYLAQAAKLVATDTPAKWLFNATTITAASTKISGFPINGTSARLNLVNLKVKKG
jgi:peptide/nickel transport system substrate-binding protein